MSDVSAIVASYNSRQFIERCLETLSQTNHEIIVVDSASSDGTPEVVLARFPNVRLLQLSENRGYGAALNEGMALSRARYFLLMNYDAWPESGAVDELLTFADVHRAAGVVGPRLVNPDGTLQPSVRGFPTPWRLATEYLFLRWLAPRSTALNAFYGSGFDHRSVRDAEFLVGAVLLVRREVIDEIGAFDTDFFMFNEEVDFCYRVREAGWRVVFDPASQFVHVGGASTRQDWSRMYREQLRSHLRFLAKHQGYRQAELARQMLRLAMLLRSVLLRGQRRSVSRDAARWLAENDVRAMLDAAR